MPDEHGGMKYGDLTTLFYVLAGWTGRYQSVECEFEIWAVEAGGSGRERRWGRGGLVLAV